MSQCRQMSITRWNRMPDASETRPPVRLLIVGCGNRGLVYSTATRQFPALGKVVAAADPIPARLEFLSRRFHVPPNHRFYSHVEMLDALRAGELKADAVVVAVPDSLHAAVVAPFAALGLHILCEKPMATKLSECVDIARASLASSKLFAIGHVLRYTPANIQIKAILDSGVLGPLVSISHTEPVGWFHFAHSYVRGNWKKECESSFTLLTKSCHDLDILHYFVGDHDNLVESDGRSPSVSFRAKKSGQPAGPRRIVNPISKISAFGGLAQFRREKKPADAGLATRCLDCAYESKCPYSARRIYLDPLLASLGALEPERASVNPYSPHFNKLPRNPPATLVPDIEDTPLTPVWPVDVLTPPPVTIRRIRRALEEGPYGKCVYESDNDVPDNYAVSFSFRSGLTGTFNLVSTSAYETGLDRRTRIFGARGELETDSRTVKWTDFTTNTSHTFDPYAGIIPADRIPASPALVAGAMMEQTGGFEGGHGGGDPALLHAFLLAIQRKDPSLLKSSAAEALESHVYVFAAEEARKRGVLVDIEEFRRRMGANLDAATEKL